MRDITTVSEWWPAERCAGAGRAQEYSSVYEKMLGYPMIGTLNLRVPDFDIRALSPSFTRMHPDLHRQAEFWMVELECGERAYAYRFPGSRQRGDVIELISKRRMDVPKKTKVRFPKPFTETEIDDWCARHYTKNWHQTFAWSPGGYADTEYLWGVIDTQRRLWRNGWNGTKVCDLGCGWGGHAIRAANRGAIATGIDSDVNSVRCAREIADHIEFSDAMFFHGDARQFFGSLVFDVILYLSVHHQFDPRYLSIDTMIHQLKYRARQDVFIELIRKPPISDKVDRMIALYGGTELNTYKHTVRGFRTIYHLPGRAGHER